MKKLFKLCSIVIAVLSSNLALSNDSIVEDQSFVPFVAEIVGNNLHDGVAPAIRPEDSVFLSYRNFEETQKTLREYVGFRVGNLGLSEEKKWWAQAILLTSAYSQLFDVMKLYLSQDPRISDEEVARYEEMHNESVMGRSMLLFKFLETKRGGFEDSWANFLMHKIPFWKNVMLRCFFGLDCEVSLVPKICFDLEIELDEESLKIESIKEQQNLIESYEIVLFGQLCQWFRDHDSASLTEIGHFLQAYPLHLAGFEREEAVYL